MRVLLILHFIFSFLITEAYLIKKSFARETIITSIERTPREQAQLMHNMKKRGISLRNLYKPTKTLDTIIAAKTVEEIEQAILDGIRCGYYISKHLCGKALDISKRGLYIDLLLFFSHFDNVEILDEGDHYHVQLKESCNE